MVYARRRSQCKRALLFRPGWRHSLGCGDLESSLRACVQRARACGGAWEGGGMG